MKEYITKQEHLILIGLLAVASSQIKAMRETESAIAELLLVEGSHGEGFGHVSDAVYSEYSAALLLKKLGIKVLKKRRLC